MLGLPDWAAHGIPEPSRKLNTEKTYFDDGRKEGKKKEGWRKENKMVMICEKDSEVRGLGTMRKWHKGT